MLVGIGTDAQRASAGKAVIADVVGRGYALSVGAIGARVLLDTLSDLGAEGHDTALRVVLRSEFPGWGYMVASNASTCWEGWDNETSPLYTGRGGHYHGSHNHAWLCGGVGEWVYSRLGGIRPTGDGFATVAIAPKVSKTLGPAAVSTSLETPRGLIQSNWTRGDTTSAEESTDGYIFFSLGMDVPLSSVDVVLPLLGRKASAVRVTSAGVVVWDGGSAAADTSVMVAVAADGCVSNHFLLDSPGPFNCQLIFRDFPTARRSYGCSWGRGAMGLSCTTGRGRYLGHFGQPTLHNIGLWQRTCHARVCHAWPCYAAGGIRDEKRLI
jgi:hypothetical protein